MKNKLPISLIGIMLLLSAQAISQTKSENDVPDLEHVKTTSSNEIQKILTETGMPSISIALVKDDKIVWAEAFGYTNVKKQVPATTATIYSTGSTFKSVTAIAVMQLAEAGMLIRASCPILKRM